MSSNSQSDDSKRWLALWVIAVASLMVVLDASIINIALPHAQAALQIGDADRHWAIAAYALTFVGHSILIVFAFDFDAPIHKTNYTRSTLQVLNMSFVCRRAARRHRTAWLGLNAKQPANALAGCYSLMAKFLYRYNFLEGDR